MNEQDAIEERRIPDPSISWSQFIHELNEGRPDAGQRTARVKMVTVIGALAYVNEAKYDRAGNIIEPGREPHHEEAAKRFKSLYEYLYGGTTKAVDPSNEPVDSSFVAHDAGMASRADKSRKMHDAEIKLGKVTFNVLVDMLVLCTPANAYGDWRKAAKINKERLSALDDLASLWELRSRSGRAA